MASDAKTDWIWLRGIRIDGARAGVLPHEHDAPCTITIELGLEVSVALAGRTERLTDTVDYASVFDLVAATVRERHYPLIETLAEVLAARVLERFAARRVRLEVGKPGALPTGTPSVAIERATSRA